MPTTITPITLPMLPVGNRFGVNCYLIDTGDGFILIDTGATSQRKRLLAALDEADCTPGTLKLIVLTHGDFDHCGSAAYLSKKFNAPIAMHPGDLGMVERGDMFAGRTPPNRIVRGLFGLLFRLKLEDRFTPDITLDEGDIFAAYGWEAEVLHLPGHCTGSIGLLTEDGDLFCGDLLGNVREPAVWMIVDDQAAMAASVAKLGEYEITTVYPGHGKPFPLDQLKPYTP